MSKVTLRTWLIFILIGLAGQFAWAIENMYLNSYIAYLNFKAPIEYRFDYSLMISLTTAVSACVASLTTIFIGALTDKIGKKKLFISAGYILWGISTACFGLFNVNSDAGIKFNITPYLAAVFVIVFDAVMTFFGSASNDATFNSYVTENTDESKRGKVENVLSILPLLSLMIIFGGLNFLTTEKEGYRWDLFFYLVGGFVVLVGIISIFLIPKEKKKRNDRSIFSLIYGTVKVKEIKKNKKLYLLFIIYFIFSLSCQIFFPYIMIYVEKTCQISNNSSSFLTDFTLVMFISLLSGSLLSLIYGFLADKYGKDKMIIPTLLTYCTGCVMMYFIPLVSSSFKMFYSIISIIVMIIGYVSVPTIINSLVRENIPKGQEGSFLGVRMFFVVLLPMSTGPFIGNYLNSFKDNYYDEFNIKSNLPNELAYLVAASVIILTIVPLFFYFREKKRGDVIYGK